MGFHREAPEFDVLVRDAPPQLVVQWVTGSILLGVTLTLFAILLHRHLQVESWRVMSVVENEENSTLNRKIRHKRNTIKILFMAPVFGTLSWLSLFFLNLAVPFELVMSMYEAVALWAFLMLMVDLLGGRKKCPEVLQHEPADKYLAAAPFFCCVPCLCPKIKIDHKWYIIIEIGVLQYLIIKPICATLALVLYFFGSYENGNMDWDHSYPYIRLVEVVSVLIAAYFLFVMWKATRNLLKKHNTSLKFACIKLVILVSVIQGFLLGGLVDHEVITDDYVLHADVIAEMWSAWLLVLEMFCLTILFFKAFPISDYYTPVDESFALLKQDNPTPRNSYRQLYTDA
mmetsp:Transcript_14812/g.20653  ORF Transcript_14812/g.20653 Transcript_14812/m.20653 type:complete len:343 (+) Transcript_14812:190-1218(+)